MSPRSSRQALLARDLAPRPAAYCTIWHGRRLPVELLRAVPTLVPTFVHPIHQCCCRSVALAGIPCDPRQCVPAIIDTARTLRDAHDAGAILGYRAKQCYQRYAAAARSATEAAIDDSALGRLIDRRWRDHHDEES